MTENISFNLLDNPWIPCKTISNDFNLMSIKEVLFNPLNILEITSENPLISISIYRLLLAILHRNFGPKNKKTWASIYKDGQWDIEVLESYFKHWHHRFELFSEPHNRFYQMDLPEIDKKTPISKINHAISSGNSVALFNHSWDSDITPISVEEGVQLLISYQNFAVGGGRSMPYNYSHAPLISGIIVLLRGDNLFETLMLNLIRYDESHPFKKDKEKKDVPFWERDDKSLNEEKNGRNPYGYIDYLTWQSRRIWIYPFFTKGNLMIKEINLAQGEKVHNDWNYDPQMVYRRDKKNKIVQVKIRKDRQVWREIESLLRLDSPDKYIIPKAIDWIAEMDFIPNNKRFNLEVYGLYNDPQNPAKIINWQRSNIPLSIAFLKNQELVNEVKIFVDKVEKIQEILNKTLKFITKDQLFPDVQSLSPNQWNTINSALDNYQIEIKYWNYVENYFYKFLHDLTLKHHDIKTRKEILTHHVELVLKKARNLLDDFKENNINDLRALKAYIQNVGYYHKHIHEIKQ